MATLPRPKSISVITIMAIIFVLLSFPMLFTPSIKRMGDFVPMILGFIITMQFISLIGIWHMKKWGVQWFIIMLSLNIITFMALGIYSFRFYFLISYSLIFLVFFLWHYRKMDSNL